MVDGHSPQARKSIQFQFVESIQRQALIQRDVFDPRKHLVMKHLFQPDRSRRLLVFERPPIFVELVIVKCNDSEPFQVFQNLLFVFRANSQVGQIGERNLEQQNHENQCSQAKSCPGATLRGFPSPVESHQQENSQQPEQDVISRKSVADQVATTQEQGDPYQVHPESSDHNAASDHNATFNAGKFQDREVASLVSFLHALTSDRLEVLVADARSVGVGN